MSWSEIPVDLFCEISKLLDIVDVVRSEAVCIWWRSIQYRKYARKSHIPWLMLPWLSTGNDEKMNSRYFYSLTEQKIYGFHLPEIADHLCIGSSHGYLFSVNYEVDLIVSNPLAKGAYLPIPPTSTFPRIDGVLRDSSSGRITKFNITIDDILYTFSYLDMLNFYYKRTILSPAADIIAVIYKYNEYHGCRDLAFARIGDQSWTVLEVPKARPYMDNAITNFFWGLRVPRVPDVRPCVDDIIFYKGYLYAVYVTGTLAVFDLNHPTDLPFMSLEGPSNERSHKKRYLVESSSGDLLMVYRYFQYIIGDEISKTNNFKIYVLDEATFTWNQIKNLGEVSLFLGFNYSMSFSTHQFPDMKRNCIYFTDDNRIDVHQLIDVDRQKSAGDMGVFNLDDKTIGQLYPNSNLSRLIWPPPIFFVPTLP